MGDGDRIKKGGNDRNKEDESQKIWNQAMTAKVYIYCKVNEMKE